MKNLDNVSTFADVYKFSSDIIELLNYCFDNRTNELLIIKGITESINHAKIGNVYRFRINNIDFCDVSYYYLDADDTSWVLNADKDKTYYLYNPKGSEAVFDIIAYNSIRDIQFLTELECTEEMYEQLNFLHKPEYVNMIMLMSLLRNNGNGFEQFVYHEIEYSPSEILKRIKDIVNGS